MDYRNPSVLLVYICVFAYTKNNERDGFMSDRVMKDFGFDIRLMMDR